MNAKERGLLRNRITRCDMCAICQPEYPPVPWEDCRKSGEGGVLVVGEAPGPVEIKIGRPFVGPAGNYLRGVVQDVGLAQDVAYANVVCCFARHEGTMKPRTPSEVEINNCRQFLTQQISAIAPDLMVLTGGTALSAWRGDLQVTKVRGNMGRWMDKYPVMVMLHPAGVLRNKQLWDREAFKEDWQIVAAVLSGEDDPEWYMMDRCVVCGVKANQCDPDWVGYCGQHINNSVWKKQRNRWPEVRVKQETLC